VAERFVVTEEIAELHGHGERTFGAGDLAQNQRECVSDPNRANEFTTGNAARFANGTIVSV
jgi:hypothetical protein